MVKCSSDTRVQYHADVSCTVILPTQAFVPALIIKPGLHAHRRSPLVTEHVPPSPQGLPAHAAAIKQQMTHFT